VLYPTLIAPLFNKFEPLKEGELRRRILEMAERSARRLQAGRGKEASAASDEETVLRDMYLRTKETR